MQTLIRAQLRALVMLVVLVSLGLPAHADRKAALRFFKAGEKAFAAQNFEAAAENLDAAFKELPVPELAFSAAQAYRRAHRVKANVAYVARAVELYTFYLAKVTEGGRVADAADSLGELERELDKLGGPKAMPATVVVKTQLALTVSLVGVDATVTMRELEDRRAGGEAAIPVVTKVDGVAVLPEKMIDVSPGPHVVRAEAPGFAPLEKREVAVEGHSELVELELQPLPAKLTIETERGARVSVDGRGIGTAPVAPIDLPAGRHVLTIIRSGREAVARELVLGRGQVMTVRERLSPTERRRAVAWVMVGAGALGVITLSTTIGAIHEDGIATDLLHQLQQGGQSEQVGRDYADARELRNRLRDGAWATGGVMLAVGIVGAFLYYVDTPSAEGLKVTPLASGGVAGASVIGRF
ncbi:MAG: PEGA domain-containing protein [Myxococcales bacterium]|nr:PEGA domain-containing protein [Myxococcales bacterium]